jgi:hypothetical protein
VDVRESQLKAAREEYVTLRERAAGRDPVIQIQKDIPRMPWVMHIDPMVRTRILEVHDYFNAGNQYLQSYSYLLQILLLAWLKDPDKGPASDEEAEDMEADCFWMYSMLLCYVSHLQPDRSGMLALQNKIRAMLPPVWKSHEEVGLLVHNVIVQPMYLSTLMKDDRTKETLQRALRYMDVAISYIAQGVNCDRVDDVYVALTRAVLDAYKGDPEDEIRMMYHMVDYVPTVREFQDALANSRNAWRPRQQGGTGIRKRNTRNNHGRRR